MVAWKAIGGDVVRGLARQSGGLPGLFQVQVHVRTIFAEMTKHKNNSGEN